jgi:hypothetical protein
MPQGHIRTLLIHIGPSVPWRPLQPTADWIRHAPSRKPSDTVIPWRILHQKLWLAIIRATPVLCSPSSKTTRQMANELANSR